MSKLYLYNYNNYFNRIFKKEATLADYGTPIYTLSTTNFNYNDGVDTSHVVNYDKQDGDYLIITDDEDVIQSRWFVIENVRNRGGQHNLTLKRDLRVDLYDVWKDKDMIVHRGWPKYFNPIIFNSEGFSFNQIKEYEELLMDESFSPWYIIYFAKNCPAAAGTITLGGTEDFTINTPLEESIYADGSTYKCYDNRRVFSNSNQKRTDVSMVDYLKLIIKGNNSFQDIVEDRSSRDRDYIWFDQNTATVRGQLTNAYIDKYSTWTNDTHFGKTNGVSGMDRIRLDTGSIIVKDSTNALYQITIYKNTNYDTESTNVTETLSNAMKSAIEATSLTREGEWGSEAFGIIYDEVTYSVHATAITSGSVNWSIDFTTKQNTTDADYNIIAIPRDTIRVYTNNDFEIVESEWSKALLESILRSTYSDGGESKPIKNYIYDVQLMPYCPYHEICTYDFTDTKIGTLYLDTLEDTMQGLNSSKQYYFSSNNDNNICFLYVEKAQFEFNINKFYFEMPNYYSSYQIDLKPNQYQQNGDIVNYKIDNECRVYRLCSPNYNGLFEFSVAKNDGVNEFNVDITLRPQNPYIHINPNFKYLYGSDFNDMRGLICQGDFSLPIVNDQWQTYEYQNKNYQNIFNRQIENLDFNFEQERIKGAFSAVAGSIVGGIGGGIAGGKTAGPYGAAAGAAIGAVASGVGGIIDYSMLTAKQEEQRSYLVDNYKYQLGNVKALSYSINKVTPLTNNNKIWPFIEIYDCTDTEKDMLYKKLKYTSFTIEKIDKLSNYGETGVLHFFQATPILLENADMPTHELQELARELEKGVYI